MLVLYPHLHLALSSGLKLQVSPPKSYVQNDKSQWEDNTDARDRPTNKSMNVLTSQIKHPNRCNNQS